MYKCSLPCAAVDYQLLLEHQILGDQSATTAWRNQLGDGCEQVEKQESDVFHAVEC